MAKTPSCGAPSYSDSCDPKQRSADPMSDSSLNKQFTSVHQSIAEVGEMVDAVAASIAKLPPASVATIPRFLSVEEFSSIVKECRPTIRRKLVRGLIRGHKSKGSRKWKIPYSELEEYMGMPKV